MSQPQKEWVSPQFDEDQNTVSVIRVCAIDFSDYLSKGEKAHRRRIPLLVPHSVAGIIGLINDGS